MRKILIIFTLLLCLPLKTYALEERAVVEMLSYTVKTPYPQRQVSIEYEKDERENQVIAQVIDNETKEVLQSWIEKPELALDEFQTAYQNETKSSLKSTWAVLKEVGEIETEDAVAYVWADVELGRDETGWIIENASAKHEAIENAAYHLNTAGTYIMENVDELVIDLNGVIEKKYPFAVRLNCNLLGKSKIYYSASSNYYERETYNTYVSFEVK